MATVESQKGKATPDGRNNSHNGSGCEVVRATWPRWGGARVRGGSCCVTELRPSRPHNGSKVTLLDKQQTASCSTGSERTRFTVSKQHLAEPGPHVNTAKNTFSTPQFIKLAQPQTPDNGSPIGLCKWLATRANSNILEPCMTDKLS